MLSKVFGACFMGAVFGAIVALQLNPKFWWVGLLVGALVGYVTYDIKAVVLAVPKASKFAFEYAVGNGHEAMSNAYKWLSTPHPIAYTAFGITLPLFYGLIRDLDMSESVSTPIALTIILMEMYVLASIVVGLLLFVLAKFGAYLENVFWHPLACPEAEDDYKVELRGYGMVEKPLTYINYWRWTVLGAISIVPYFCWALLDTFILPGIKLFLRITFLFVPLFVWQMFKLIHSDVRVLCACDAAIGAAVGYFYANPLLGGVVGGTFGVLNYEVVSKRLLRLNVQM